MRNKGLLLLVAVLTLGVTASAGADPVPGCDLSTPLWTWDGSAVAPTHPFPREVPLVAQTNDDNGDGVIDSADDVDVVIVHADGDIQVSGPVEFKVSVVDGATGMVSVTLDLPASEPGIAIADLDRDCSPELIYRKFFRTPFGSEIHGLGAIELLTGELWTRNEVNPDLCPPGMPIGVADFDLHPGVEIYCGAQVFDALGHSVFEGTGPIGTFGAYSSHAVDLDGDGSLELLSNGRRYDPFPATSGLTWEPEVLLESATPGELDPTIPGPEVVGVAANDVNLVSAATGELIASFTVTPPAGNVDILGQPTLADLDGDGDSEIVLHAVTNVLGVNTPGYLLALDANGGELNELWMVPGDDDSSIAWSVPAAADLDGDGRFEVVFSGVTHTRVHDPSTGEVRNEVLQNSQTAFENPILADLNGDGTTEIISLLGFGTEVVARTCGPDVAARAVWNQKYYHVTHIDEDMQVPDDETAPWPQLGAHALAQATPPGGLVPGPLGSDWSMIPFFVEEKTSQCTGNGTSSVLYLTNRSDEQVTVKPRFYTAAGNEIPLVLPITVSLDPGGMAVFPPVGRLECYFAGDPDGMAANPYAYMGTVVLETSCDPERVLGRVHVQGQGESMNNAEGLSLAAQVESSAELWNDGFVSYFPSGGGSNNAQRRDFIVVANPQNVPVEVQLQFFDIFGDALSLIAGPSGGDTWPPFSNATIPSRGCLIFNTASLETQTADQVQGTNVNEGERVLGSAIVRTSASGLNAYPSVIGANVSFEQEPGSNDTLPEATPDRSLPTFGTGLRTMYQR